MTTPLCPVHAKPMRQGQYGFFCTAFVGQGLPGANANGYCDQKAKAHPVAAPQPQAAPGVMLQGSGPLSSPSESELRLEALRFVGNVMQGSSSTDTVLMRDMAKEMLDFLRGTE